MMSDIITLNIPSKPEYLLTARLAASSVASRMGFDVNDIEDIKTATAESLVIMMHQQHCEEIKIAFLNHPERLEVTVVCTLRSKSHIEPSEEDDSLSKYLIEALADGLELDEEDGRINKIQFKKKLQR